MSDLFDTGAILPSKLSLTDKTMLHIIKNWLLVQDELITVKDLGFWKAEKTSSQVQLKFHIPV